jgi:PAS domain S-box-containing protein
VENAPDYIVTVDRDSRIQFINRMAAESGFSAEEILGADVTGMVVPEQQGRVAEAIRNVFETGSSEYCEGAYVRTSGATAWYGGQIGPIWDQGKVVAAILVIRDITEQREVDEMKDSLIRDVSHELRSPLAKVQMSLDLLSELLEDEEMDRQRASRISNLANLNVQRLLQTVDLILDEMMGDEFLLDIRRKSQYAHIPVIIVSVLPIERCQHLLDGDPKTVFLRKPFRRGQLLDTVERSLAKTL